MKCPAERCPGIIVTKPIDGKSSLSCPWCRRRYKLVEVGKKRTGRK